MYVHSIRCVQIWESIKIFIYNGSLVNSTSDITELKIKNYDKYYEESSDPLMIVMNEGYDAITKYIISQNLMLHALSGSED